MTRPGDDEPTRVDPSAPAARALASSAEVRFVARARDVDDLVRLYHPYVDDNALMVPLHPALKPGETSAFALVLDPSGIVVLRGRATIASAGSDEAALRLGLLELDAGAKALHRRMLSAKRLRFPAKSSQKPPAAGTVATLVRAAPFATDVPGDGEGQAPAPEGNEDSTVVRRSPLPDLAPTPSPAVKTAGPAARAAAPAIASSLSTAAAEARARLAEIRRAKQGPSRETLPQQIATPPPSTPSPVPEPALEAAPAPPSPGAPIGEPSIGATPGSKPPSPQPAVVERPVEESSRPPPPPPRRMNGSGAPARRPLADDPLATPPPESLAPPPVVNEPVAMPPSEMMPPATKPLALLMPPNAPSWASAAAFATAPTSPGRGDDDDPILDVSEAPADAVMTPASHAPAADEVTATVISEAVADLAPPEAARPAPEPTGEVLLSPAARLGARVWELLVAARARLAPLWRRVPERPRSLVQRHGVLVGCCLASFLLGLALRGGSAPPVPPAVVAAPLPVAPAPAPAPALPAAAPRVEASAAPAAPTKGTLRISSSPPGALVTLGKWSLGRTPREVPVDLGQTVRLTARLRGHRVWVRQVALHDPETVVNIELQRAAAPKRLVKSKGALTATKPSAPGKPVAAAPVSNKPTARAPVRR